MYLYLFSLYFKYLVISSRRNTRDVLQIVTNATSQAYFTDLISIDTRCMMPQRYYASICDTKSALLKGNIKCYLNSHDGSNGTTVTATAATARRTGGGGKLTKSFGVNT